MILRNKINFIFILGLLLFISLNCNFKEGIEAGEKAVAKFHKQFNNKDFNEIYEKADDGFKESDSKEKIIGFLEKVREKLGKVKESKRMGWNVNKNLEGTFATISFETEFEKGSGTETFVFLISGEDTKLINYHVNSKDLILN